MGIHDVMRTPYGVLYTTTAYNIFMLVAIC